MDSDADSYRIPTDPSDPLRTRTIKLERLVQHATDRERCMLAVPMFWMILDIIDPTTSYFTFTPEQWTKEQRIAGWTLHGYREGLNTLLSSGLLQIDHFEGFECYYRLTEKGEAFR